MSLEKGASVWKNIFAGIGIVFVILIVINYFQNSNVSSEQETAFSPYLSKIAYEDLNLKVDATNMAGKCDSGNKECQVVSIYSNLVNNYKYYSDTRYEEFIQSPQETKQVMGGDCEDLTILLNSLLENIGIKTYMVFTDNHAYSLACNLESKTLQEEIISSFIKNETIYDSIVSVPAMSARYFGGDGSLLNFASTMTYSVDSNLPLDIEFVDSQEALQKWSEGKSYNHYPDCFVSQIYSSQGSCSMGNNGGMMVINNNGEDSKLSLKINAKYVLIDPSAISTTYYELEGEKCFILDPTLGEYGYPGYDINITGNKTAIDPITKKQFILN